MRGVLHHHGPAWFTCVMGTAAVAIAAALLPVDGAALDALAVGAWGLAFVLLALFGAAAAVAWRRGHRSLRRDALDPAVAPLLAAPPIAVLSVATSTLLTGPAVLGAPAALAVGALLWVGGTAGGLAVAVVVPAAKFSRHTLTSDTWMATWILPTVPPLVSAAGAAELAPHLPAGQWQLSLLLVAGAMAGATLVATLAGIAMLWARLAFHRVGEAAAAPTLWLVLGPLGQAVTAAVLLGDAAADIAGGPAGTGLHVAALVVSLPLWGFAMLWLAIAAALTADVARRHLPFTLGWWGFVYPLGTCTTGSALLAEVTGAAVFGAAAAVLFAALLAAWLLAAAGTIRGTVRGDLVAVPPAPAEILTG